MGTNINLVLTLITETGVHVVKLFNFVSEIWYVIIFRLTSLKEIDIIP
jgi:hypothetical protein